MNRVYEIFVQISEGLKVVERNDSIRVFKIHLIKKSYKQLQKLQMQLEKEKLGSLTADNESLKLLGNSDLKKDYDTEIYKKEQVDILIKKSADFIFFFTDEGFKNFLSNSPDEHKNHRLIALSFIEKPFSTLISDFVPLVRINEYKGENRGAETLERIPATKFVKSIDSTSQKFLPKDIHFWLLNSSDLVGLPNGWERIASIKLLFCLATEVASLADGNQIELIFKGEIKKILYWRLNEAVNCTYQSLNNLCRWIFVDSRDIDTRHNLVNYQFSNINKKRISEVTDEDIGSIMQNASDSYKYHLSEESKKVVESLSGLSKNLFDYTVKIRESTQSVINAVWKDFTASILFVILRIFVQKDKVLPAHFYLITIGVVLYLVLSGITTFLINKKHIDEIEDGLRVWKNRLYFHLSDSDFEELAIKYITKPKYRFIIVSFGALLIYLVLLAVVAYLGISY